jgi:hypothetical protein
MSQRYTVRCSNGYDPARVDKIYALEPNPRMFQLAERRLRRTALTVEFFGVPGERIPLADAGGVDYTFVDLLRS